MLQTKKTFLAAAFFLFLFSGAVRAQKTTVRGFIDATATYANKLSFGFGEQDLFITSQLTDRISFLGETVFKPDSASRSGFGVSIERVIIKYNIGGNHNLLIGKHHTPLNYWNDTYHHGRVFFPTISRPLLFDAGIIPLHTTGIGLEGHDLGTLKAGYNLMVGNGLGSQDVKDNDSYKSVVAGIYIKPVRKLRLGLTYYHDVISKNARLHDHPIAARLTQQLLSGSVAYFGKKYELLAEGTAAFNHTDSTHTRHTLASYLYAGYKITDKWIPYMRVDNLAYQPGELLFKPNNTTALTAGIRYQASYLSVIKLEYLYQHLQHGGDDNRLTAQFAIGF